MSITLYLIIYFVGVCITAWFAGFTGMEKDESPIMFAFVWPATVGLIVMSAPFWIPWVIYKLAKGESLGL